MVLPGKIAAKVVRQAQGMSIGCPYCRKPATFHLDSSAFYNGTDYGPLWACVRCGAWVGCHENTAKPLGRLADSALRVAKQKAHAAFDPLWKAKWRQLRAQESLRNGAPAPFTFGKKQARGRAYLWLAQRLGIERKDCHIGMFDVVMCERVVEACSPYMQRRAA